jgi:diguanylate cyclase (GGDEF)-like protein/PAS domain S-box-containing protein
MAKLVFADKKSRRDDSAANRQGWKVLIVDDDAEVHSITELALRSLTFLGRPIEFLHAYSGIEAQAVLGQNPDVSLILLDVVMETDDAGLRFVEHVRGEVGNTKVRIVLRTGQPGQAPEQDVILRYDINDYKAKTELTQQKLYTTVITALRGYQDLIALESGRQGLRKIIDASASLMQSRSMRMFASGVLTQLSGLLGTTGCGILCTQAEPCETTDLTIIAASGKFEPLLSAPPDTVDPDVINRIRLVLARRETLIAENYTILYLRTPNFRDVAIYVEADRPLEDLDRSLLEVFGTNISVGFDNLEMIDRIVQNNEVLERRVIERTRDLHDREARLLTIMEASPIAVAILKLEDDQPIFANSRFFDLLGLTAGQTGDITLGGLFADPADRSRVGAALAGEDGVIGDLEVSLNRTQGGHFWGLLSARRLEVSGHDCALIWLYDISQRKEMERELRQFATTDHLTSVANRRHFLETAALEFERSRRYGHPLTVIMADIDFFKKINDTYGHQVGDRVIRAFADALQSCLRGCDLVGRLGGEEFAVILPETPAAESLSVAERIRAAIEALEVSLPYGGSLRFTASFGCAARSEGDGSIDATLARADAALYRSKDCGRNSVTAAD